MSSSGSRTSMLIPDVVALNCKLNTTRPFYIYAKPDSTSDTATITHLEFGRATHRAAQILRPNREGSDGQVVALIALSDTVLYQAVVVGLITANFIPFPISPRNSTTAIVQLLRKTSCHRLIATCVTLQPLLIELEQEIARLDPDFVLDIEEIPSLLQIYPNLGAETSDCPFESYAASTSHPSFDDTCLYLHSSGSTGFPKCIPATHRVLMQWDAITELRDHLPHPPAAMALPSFHMFGIYGQLLQPIYGCIPVAVYPPTAISPDALPVIPSPENIIEHARKTNCKVMMGLPTLLAVWSKSPETIAYLKTLHLVGWSGGGLPPRLGQILFNAGLKLRAVYGATEFGAISTIIPWRGDEQEWEWLRFSEDVKLRWVPQGDGSFECQVLTSEEHSVSVENLDDVRGYSTSDLWINHPVKKHLWKIIGRIDDVIVHTSGEKTVPAPMENIVMSDPRVAGTVMFGRDREQTGILIEPIPALQVDVQNETQVTELRNKLWPTIEEANGVAPAFSRIFKEMILFTSTDKPLPRAGKGTVMRKAAVNMYAPEIDALYDLVGEKSNTTDFIELPTLWTVPAIRGWLVKLAADLTKALEISPEVDLFHQGFDSLSANFLRLRILGAIRSSKDRRVQKLGGNITQNLVYSYPTISQLSAFLHALITGTVEDTNMDAKVLIDEMVTKYTLGLVRPVALPSNTGNPAVVLLTGSTGSLGSQILASLLSDSRVVKVYTCNRPSSSSSTLAQRHSNVFKERGLDTALLDSSKLILVEGQTDQADLGLKSDLYNEMRDSVTLIIHNAWKLDFNMSLASFEPHILGTRHLIDLALASPRYPRFLFTSSIASAISWDTAKGPCPEEILSDASVAAEAPGYGQSKFVAEQILSRSGLHTTCLRIGQICGALPKGAWATTDWVPILVKTSITLGQLPLADGLVSWIDFETVAQAVTEVAFAPSADLSSAFNLVHPRPVSWNFVVTSLRDAMKRKKDPGIQLKLVQFSNWFNLFEPFQDSNSDELIDFQPGIKLLDFFYHLSNSSVGSAESEFGGIKFSTTKIQKLSSAVKDVDVIKDETVESWIEYWNASGFI
ncbi:putative aminoadipate reductase [Mycena sp. CBHHK59/15]|nr:putative aminoadipate reductase [Mycena sp. CBHHK59/15]